MRQVTALLMLLTAIPISSQLSASAQSTLLESVKRNPGEAKALCGKLRDYNSKGIQSSSKEVIEEISRQRNLSPSDAEILSIYVIGMHCPDVR